ncbi:hypothetical protein BDA99DRAFT_264593 [Phascolomyces articulosus]|uniref:PA domain-containing protein n=1 Tax=Phascolomyces articulosus TaxID=60185 RepID=A0AAD5JNJ9_9FUNG|nr:hypothetical protein BDA99DRAFT_264593 [Phascolomyces articulosus]
MDAIEPYLQHASSIIELDHGDNDQQDDHEHKQLQEEDGMIEVRVHGDSISNNYYGMSSTFGASFSSSFHDNDDVDIDDQTATKNLELVYFLNNEQGLLGCEQYRNQEKRKKIRDKVLILSRGGCTFTTKVQWAQEAGAKAVIFVNNDTSGTAFRAMSDNTMNESVTNKMIPSMTVSLEDGIDIITFDEASKENQMNIKVDLIKSFIRNTSHNSDTGSGSRSIISNKKPVHIKLHGEIVHNFIVF